MRRTLLALFTLSAFVFAGTTVNVAEGATGAPGAWPTWTITPEDPEAADHSGTINFGLSGMPDAVYTVTKSEADGEDTKLGTNDDEYIGAGTPFGQVFGASGPSTGTQFLKTRIDTDIIDKATVEVTFATPVPAGVLGFAVSDIDVDQVLVSGTQSGGAPISGAELMGEAFNLCDTPDAPESCDGESAPFPLPTWNPVTRTVVGSGADTDGEAAWFRPTVAVETLTFDFSGQDMAGSPSFRLWLAALGATVSGTVTSTCTAATQPALLTLTYPDGSELQPAPAAAADGSYTFNPALAVDGYRVNVLAPPGCAVEGTDAAEVDLSAGDATVNFKLINAPGPTPQPTPRPTPAPVTPKFTG